MQGQIPKKLQIIFANFHITFLLVCLGILTYKSFVQFTPAWDYLSYHLPGILRQYGNKNYISNQFIENIFKGWPTLPYQVSALSMRLTGLLSSANSANAIAFNFALAALWLQWRSRFSVRWFLTIVFALPLFILHFTSGYLDIFNAAFILLTFGSMLSLKKNGFTFLSAIFTIIGAVGVSLTKLQGWPIICILLLSGFFSRDKRIIITTLLAYAVFSFWPLRNIYLYKNPTFPMNAPILSSLFSGTKEAPVESNSSPIEILNGYPRSLVFLYSYFSIDRIYGDAPVTLDQGRVEGPKSPHHRIGGFFWLTTLVIFVWSVKYIQFEIGALLLSFLFVSILPFNYELRYWMYIPFCLAFWISVQEGIFKKDKLDFLCKFLILISLGIVLKNYFVLDLASRQPIDLAPQEAKDFWATADKTQLHKLCEKVPNTIYWTGPTFSEYKVQDLGYCDNDSLTYKE